MRMLASFLVACALCLGSVVAQDKPAAKKPMEKAHAKAGEKKEKPAMPPEMMAKPSPEIQKLSKIMVGTWNAVETHEANEMMPAGSSKGVEVVKAGPGGLSLISDYKATGTMGKFAGHGVMWWDEKEKAYRSMWCDNMTPGGCMVGGTGKWEGNDVVFNEEGEMMGKKYKMRETMTDITPTSFTFHMDAATDGGEMKRTMSIKYSKAGGAGAAAKPAAEAPKKK